MSGIEKMKSKHEETTDTKKDKHVPAWRKQIRPRAFRTAIAAAIMMAIGVVGYRIDQYQWWGILVLFTAALVVGESLELKLANRPPIPVSFAGIMALARTVTNEGQFSWTHTFAVIVASLLISTACYAGLPFVARAKIFGARLATYTVGLVAAHGLLTGVNPSSQLLYAILIASIICMLGVHELFAWADGFPRTYGFFPAAAHASVLAGAVLIGVGYAGTEVFTGVSPAQGGGNGLGISALITCAIPLLVAWFAFSRYYSALKTYQQTIRALSAAPELGGIVAWGHADRVAKIADAIAERLDLAREDRQTIETACYMHTLGDAVLDTTMDIDPYEEAEAANITADIIRQSGGLARVADIIEDHVRPYRGIVDGNLVAQNDIAASIMRVSNDFDNISRREETWGQRALAAMHNAPTATYNPKALEALEWVLTRDRYNELVNPPEMPERIRENLYS